MASDQRDSYRLPVTNRLLSSMPPDTRERLLSGARRVSEPVAAYLLESGQPVRSVYFPEGGLVSLVPPLALQNPVIVGIVGHEGMVGVAGFLHPEMRPGSAMVEIELDGWQVPGEVLLQTVATDAIADALLKRYVAAQMTEMRTSIACITLHPVPGRLARWLLTVQDRVQQDTFPATQQFLAGLTLVSRQRLNRAATGLRREGLIDYQRGNVTIKDRVGLRRVACQCYDAVQCAFDAVHT